uniref:transketolase-like TK C-terminal-containing protein n=1 Tax=Leisingera sp. ANG-DT TaxID=1577897 RepID=UPI00187C1FD9|nr:hypothetical protein [Leisingera sp. ANG-DT]
MDCLSMAKLEAEGIGSCVVSMPSMELFAHRDEAYRRKVLPVLCTGILVSG